MKIPHIVDDDDDDQEHDGALQAGDVARQHHIMWTIVTRTSSMKSKTV